MTILVTGATGTIGGQVVQQLVKRGADVRALVRNPAQSNLPAAVEVVQGDLFDIDSLRAAFSGVSTLFLLNAVTADDVKRVANKYLDPSKMAIVIVGDRKAIEPGLKDLGLPINMLDTEGNAIADAAAQSSGNPR